MCNTATRTERALANGVMQADAASPIGVYVHVPFCVQKCPYCDFYSLAADETTKDRYVTAILRDIAPYKGRAFADTLYFGGGTPSLLGAERVGRLTTALTTAFCIQGSGEITLEANPGDSLAPVFSAFRAAGGNRVSLGVQAADEPTLKALGRRHTLAQARQAVETAHACGIANVSVDLMLGVTGQTTDTVRAAVATVAAWGVTHVSAYLLKIEPNTPFGKTPPSLPDEDETAALYLAAVDALRQAGFSQYEISNFARSGFESRHNLKYWNAASYLGFGPAAHSYFGGRRFFFNRDLAAFLQRPLPARDEQTDTDAFAVGSKEEYALLRLRLCEGLSERAFFERFGEPIPSAWRARAEGLPSSLLTVDDAGIRFSAEGFLVSNALFTAIL